jgi:hypothetical protein
MARLDHILTWGNKKKIKMVLGEPGVMKELSSLE